MKLDKLLLYLDREGVGLVDLGNLRYGLLVLLVVVAGKEGVLQCPEELPKPWHIQY